MKYTDAMEDFEFSSVLSNKTELSKYSDGKIQNDNRYIKTFYIWPIVVQRCTVFVLNSWRLLYILNYFIFRCHSNPAILATDLVSRRKISFEVQVSFSDGMLSVVSPSVWPSACLYTLHFLTCALELLGKI